MKPINNDKTPVPIWEHFLKSADRWTFSFKGKDGLPRNGLFPLDFEGFDAPFVEDSWMQTMFQVSASNPMESVKEVFEKSPRLSSAKYVHTTIKHPTLFPQSGVFPVDLEVPNGGFYALDKGSVHIFRRSDCGFFQEDVPEKEKPIVRVFLKLLLLRKALLKTQAETAEEICLEDILKGSQKIYQQAVKQHGKLKNWRYPAVDPRFYTVRWAFEDQAGNMSDFLKRRTRRSTRIPDFQSIPDAAKISIGYRARVDIDWIVQHSSWTKEEVLQSLLEESLVFPHWNGEAWDILDGFEYLSRVTNIKTALKDLEDSKPDLVLQYGEDQYDRCHQKLTSASPLPFVPPGENIEVKVQSMLEAGVNFADLNPDQQRECLARTVHLEVGNPLLGAEIYESYFRDRFSTEVTIEIESHLGQKKVSISPASAPVEPTPNGLPQTDMFTGFDIFCRILEGKSPRFFVKSTDQDGKVVKIEDEKESQALLAGYKAWKEDFQEWLWSDDDRSLQLARVFNETMNVSPHLRLEGEILDFTSLEMPPGFNWYPYQKDGVYQLLRFKRVAIPLGCGGGKTLIAIGGMLELKARGIVNKPCFTVLKATKHNMINVAKQIAPWATIFSFKNSSTKEERRQAMMTLLHGDFDLAILTHEDLISIPIDPAFISVALEHRIRALEEELKSLQGGGFRVKAIGAEIDRLRAFSQKVLEKNQSTFSFQDFVFDCIVVDESHASFQNPGATTSYNDVKGISTRSAYRSMKLMVIFHYMLEKGHRIGAMSATPVVSSLVELYNIMRYFIPDVLRDHELSHLDDWIETFCTISADTCFTSGGKMGIREEVRDLHNIDVLLGLMRQFMLLVPYSEQKRILADCPDMIDVTVPCPPTSAQVQLYQQFAKRVMAIQDKKPMGIPTQKVLKLASGEKEIQDLVVEDNHLLLYLHMRLSALSAKTALGSYGLNEELNFTTMRPKVLQLAQNCYLINKELERRSLPGTQLVFLDLSTKKPDRFSVYEYLERLLTALGCKTVVVHDLKNPQQELVEIAQKGERVVLILSTRKGSTGTDGLQKYCVAAHHLDIPTTPTAIVQRNGRGARIGNVYPKVLTFYYLTQGANGNAGVDAICLQAAITRLIPYQNLMGGINPGASIQDIGGEIVLTLSQLKAVATGSPEYTRLSALQTEITLLESDLKSQQLAVANDRANRAEAENKISSNTAYLAQVEPFIGKLTGLKAIEFDLTENKGLLPETFEGRDAEKLILRCEEIGGVLKGIIIADGVETPTKSTTAYLKAIVYPLLNIKRFDDVQQLFLCKVNKDFDLLVRGAYNPSTGVPYVLRYVLSYSKTGLEVSLPELAISKVFTTLAKHLPQAYRKAQKELEYYQRLQETEPIEISFDRDHLAELKAEARTLTALLKSLDNLKERRVIVHDRALDLGLSYDDLLEVERALEIGYNGQLREAKEILDRVLKIQVLDPEQEALIEKLTALMNDPSAYPGEKENAAQKIQEIREKSRVIKIEDITEIIKEEYQSSDLSFSPTSGMSNAPTSTIVDQIKEAAYIPSEYEGKTVDWLAELNAVLDEHQKQPIALLE